MGCQRREATLHLGGALVALIVTGVDLAGCSRPACYAGLSGRVADHCGCYPPQQRSEAALGQTGLPNEARDRFHECWTANVAGAAGAAAKTLPDVSAAVKACVEREETLNPEVMKDLERILDDARQQSNDPGEQARVGTWQRCSDQNTQ